MTCPVCGNEPPCKHGWRSSVLLAEQTGIPESSSEPDEAQWREEIASRVQQHRARRRNRDGSDTAMEFDFPPTEALAVTEEPVTRYRLRKAEPDVPAIDEQAIPAQRSESKMQPAEPKIIRFPRTYAAASSPYWTPDEPAPAPEPQACAPVAQSDELEIVAEPRIIEVPEPVPQYVQSLRAEQLDLLPSFEDIHLDAVHTPAVAVSESNPNPAPLQQRSIAAVVDLSCVGLAVVLFYFTFGRLAEENPHSRVAVLCVTGVSAILWVLFQYIFLVHGRGTPGMRFAELELATLEGKAPPLAARQCRALATTLSGFSLGLGYAWALIDEDQLGWHDRITGTMLRSPDNAPPCRTEIWE